MSTVEEIQSAPEDLFLLPHGVLHVVTIFYATWSTPYGLFLVPYGVL